MTADIGPLIALHQVHAAAAAHAHVLASWSQEQPPGHNALPALSLHNLHQRYIIKTRRKTFGKASRHVLHNDHARHRRRQHLHNTPDGFRTACRSADGDDLVCRVSQRPLFLSGNRPLRRKLFFFAAPAVSRRPDWPPPPFLPWRAAPSSWPPDLWRYRISAYSRNQSPPPPRPPW